MDINSSLADAFDELTQEEERLLLEETFDLTGDDFKGRTALSSSSEKRQLLLERFKVPWPVLWRVLCDHLVSTGLISEDQAFSASNNYSPMKKAILALARDNTDLLKYFPPKTIRRVAACENPTPRDRKTKNAFKRLRQTFIGSDLGSEEKVASSDGVGEASFQDLMRIMFKAQLISSDPALMGQKSSRELLFECTPALRRTLQILLVPEDRELLHCDTP